MNVSRACTALISTVVLCQQAAAGTPHLTCERPTLDFQSIISTQTVCHIFPLRNTGDAPVTITRIQSSCGCTTVKPGRTVIPPGETEPMEVCFNAKGRHGAQNRFVFLSWNNTDKIPLRLSLTGMVFNAVECEPAAVNFGVVAPTGALEQVVRFFDPSSNHAFRVTGITIPHACFSNRMETVAEGHDYRVRIFASGPRRPGLSVLTTLTVTTDNPEFIAFRVPITLRVSGRAGPQERQTSSQHDAPPDDPAVDEDEIAVAPDTAGE